MLFRSKRIGLPEPREREPGFASLIRIIVGQQVSAASARALWNKLSQGVTPFGPEAILLHTPDSLRQFGLSRQKAAYTHGLATAVAARSLDLDLVHQMEDDAAITELTKIKGFGRWSAEIYLLFSLQRPDVFPSGDLALAVAMQRLKGLRKRPDPKRLLKLVEPWRPYRSAAALFLWHFHHNMPFLKGER